MSEHRLNEQIAELRQERDALSQQVEDYVHQLQVNIQGILTDSELLLIALSRSDLSTAQSDARDLLQKINLLLLTGHNIRPNLGGYEFVKRAVAPLISDSISVFQSLAEARGIEVTFDSLVPIGLSICVSPNHIQHAFHNVLHNAIKYSYERIGPPRTVDITLKVHNAEFVVVKTVNYGVPIDLDELAHITDAGVRGRHAQKKFRTGSGRGLSVVKDIVDKHGGKLAIDSKVVPGGGVTTVQLYLPLLCGPKREAVR